MIIFAAATTSDISTHTLRKEGDRSHKVPDNQVRRFQPTPSARRVTYTTEHSNAPEDISTHTLRKEGDQPRL